MSIIHYKNIATRIHCKRDSVLFIVYILFSLSMTIFKHFFCKYTKTSTFSVLAFTGAEISHNCKIPVVSPGPIQLCKGFWVGL